MAIKWTFWNSNIHGSFLLGTNTEPSDYFIEIWPSDPDMFSVKVIPKEHQPPIEEKSFEVLTEAIIWAEAHLEGLALREEFKGACNGSEVC